MKREWVTPFVFAVALVMLCVPAFAHHGGSDYDTIHLKNLKGTVTEFLWENPHCQVFFDVNEVKAGNPVRWGIETLAPPVFKKPPRNPQPFQTPHPISNTF